MRIRVCAGLNKGADGAEGDSGSTGWSNSLRSRLFLRTPSLDNGEVPDPNARVLQRKKANYATRNDEIKLRWRNGVIEPEAAGFTRSQTAFGKIVTSKTCLSACSTNSPGMKRPAVRQRESPETMRRAFLENCRATKRHDYREGDFNRAMEGLFRSRAIENLE